jgi:hypothetical protein
MRVFGKLGTTSCERPNFCPKCHGRCRLTTSIALGIMLSITGAMSTGITLMITAARVSLNDFPAKPQLGL